MENNRGVYSMYVSTVAGGMILKRLCKNIGQILNDLEDNISKHEVIEVSEWSEDMYYITIDDERITNSENYLRFSIAIDIKQDMIIWNDDVRYSPTGGNCFVRGGKWKKFVNKYFNKKGLKQKIHFYND